MNIGKGNEQNGTLDAGGQEKRQSFVKEVKAFADEICKKLGLSFLEEVRELLLFFSETLHQMMALKYNISSFGHLTCEICQSM